MYRWLLLSVVLYHVLHMAKEAVRSCCRAAEACWGYRRVIVRAQREVHTAARLLAGKESLLSHLLLFPLSQLSWQSWPGWAFCRRITMKEVSKDFILKLFTTISLLLPGVGAEGFAQTALLAHQWARGDGGKGPLCQWFSWSQEVTSVHKPVLSNDKLYDVTFYVTAWQTVTFQIAVSSAFFLHVCSEDV